MAGAAPPAGHQSAGHQSAGQQSAGHSAGYSEPDAERRVPEPPKDPSRGAFARDRARVVHSSALRRLAAKTQVLGPGTDDFVRNRLTHSLEVAQVGRELGRALGCDPDVVDTACLAHDLGHPPFGHNGEQALAEVAGEIGGFEGNAQTLRLLTRLEPKVVDPVSGAAAGLNLTRASLDAVAKYPWRKGEGPYPASSKFGVYEDDLPVFAWLRAGVEPSRRCLEAQVMDLADDISYSVHDVEDAVVGGRLDLDVLRRTEDRDRVCAQVVAWYGADLDAAALRAAMDRLVALPFWVHGFDESRRALAALKDLTSELIGRFCRAAEAATRTGFGAGPLTRYGADLLVPEETRAEILVLKGLAVTFVMAPRAMEPLQARQQELLGDLARVLCERGPDALERPFALDWSEASDDAQRLRVVVDQVAALTDVRAHEWHRRLVGS